MRKRNLVITVVVVVVVVGVVIGLVASGFGRGGPTVPTQILIGVPAPQTGMYAGFGAGGVWGMQAAVNDINALGGVYVAEYGKNLTLKLDVRDTASDPTTAGTIAEDLIVTDKVNFLAYGDQPPTMTAPIATKAQAYKIPYICTTGPLESYKALRDAASPTWTYTWACGLFAIGDPGDKGPGYTIADTWLAMLNQVGNETNRVAGVFASADPDGIGWHAAFPAILTANNYTVIDPEDAKSLLPMDTTDFSSLISDWVAANVSIIWGNAPAPFVGTLLEQAYATSGFHPKLISIGRAPLFYSDVTAWTGNVQCGVLVETWWDPAWGDSPGIGTTTPESLAARYLADTGAPAVNRCIGAGYSIIQVLVDAIQRAGSLDADKVCAALATTDLPTIRYTVKFDTANQFSRGPLVYSQWQYNATAGKWECPIVLSKHAFIPTTGNVTFPIPSPLCGP